MGEMIPKNIGWVGAVLFIAAACATDTTPGGGRRGPSGGNAFGNAAGASGGTGGSGSFGNGSQPVGSGGSASGPTREPMQLGDGEVCDADVYAGERKRLDIYMMVDDSGSMVPWWLPTLEAIDMFFMDPGSAGIGVGVQFFGSACDPAGYATPRVPIAELPGNMSALQQAFPIIPIEGTATLPAMQGAIAHARSWAMQHPDAKTVVLLVTDGLPDDCFSTVQNVTEVVQEGFTGTPSIQTFVVGLGDLGALNQFAVAGGTGQALVVMPGAAQELVRALNDIRSAALPCDFRMPQGDGTSAVQPDRVNLRYTDPSGQALTIGAVADQASCDPTQGGWYYDNPSAPTQLIACEQSCAQLNAGGEVKVLLGCPTVHVVPE